MKLANVKLICAREIRDQLRDRRTLFIIAVLPIVLYPLLGMSLFQIAQFTQQQKARILVVGAGNRAASPSLFDGNHFARWLFGDPKTAELLELHFDPQDGGVSAAELRRDANTQVKLGAYEAALWFPPDFATRLNAVRKSIVDRRAGRDDSPHQRRATVAKVPSPDIIYNTASDKSQLACARLCDVLGRWTKRIEDENLELSGVPKAAVRPFAIGAADVASPRLSQGVMWAKILPVLLLVWALTGAFYPAIDLCAGEKERGTLETLLCSPAARGEIVLGKLITVMLFSAMTALLNLLSVGVTGWAILTQLPGFGVPPVAAIVALGVALLPISALFSALCLALAAFARSTKEGQYYLMPLLILSMPLVILPMSPGVQLSLGTSLIPVTGIVLLLRSLLEGDYWPAIQFAPAVAAVTVAACMLSIRWAVDQFNSESVLFREGERLDLRLWLRHLIRDRGPTPTVAAALCCGVCILVVRFSVGPWITMPASPTGFALGTILTQLLMIAAPALVMAMLFTSAPRQTLLLRWPAWWTIPGAAILAAALHPSTSVVSSAVERLYPMSDDVRRALEELASKFQQTNVWLLLLLIAVLPAICEELAFRGFILSGFRHLGHKWRAIILSALLFGLAHGILQQSLIASLIGVMIGYLAVQSGSILPGMVFHLVHNALPLANASVTPAMFPPWAVSRLLVTPGVKGGCVFGWPLVAAGAVIGLLVLICFSRLPCAKSAEESLEEAIKRGESSPEKLVCPERTIAGG
ncbi:MAG: ABC transporter permease subunit [Planctomycetaceae bacterium]|nr:ABC transporter permease subunit [Planctomycetaceae bacterium]